MSFIFIVLTVLALTVCSSDIVPAEAGPDTGIQNPYIGEESAKVFCIRNEDGDVVIDRSDIESAEAQIQMTDFGTDYIVLITFNEEGAEKFSEATSQAAADGSTLSIYLDDELIMKPRVMERILDGRCVLNGLEDFEQAEMVAEGIMQSK